MASYRNVQDNNILHNKESDVREELSEVQSEIKDLLPTWDQNSHNNKSSKLGEFEMEEGELSGEEIHLSDSSRSQRRNTSDFNFGRREPIQITIQNKDAAKLPVLIYSVPLLESCF